QNSARARVADAQRIELERQLAGRVGELAADKPRDLVELDILVVPGRRFRGGRKNRLGKLLALFEARRKLVPADRAGFQIILPAGTGDEAARDAFDRKGLGAV